MDSRLRGNDEVENFYFAPTQFSIFSPCGA